LDKLLEVEVQATEVLSVCELLNITGTPKPSEDSGEQHTKFNNIKKVVAELVSGNEVNLSRLNGLLKAPRLLAEYEKFYDVSITKNWWLLYFTFLFVSELNDF